MKGIPHRDGALSILIPWDGLTPINQVLTFARSLGGRDARLAVLPVAPALKAGGARIAELAESQSELKPMHPLVQMIELPAVRADPVAGIGAVAAKHDVDLILMATHCHPAGELDPSCLAAQLALDSPTPVMVVQFDCTNLAAFPPRITRLLVPLDGSIRAAEALPFTVSMASRLRVPVRLVMVIDPVQALPPAFAYDPTASDMLAGLRGEAHWTLTQAEQLLARRGVRVSSDLLTGPVVRSLEAAVEPGDVLVMTTHGLGSALRGRLGSVAARMVADIPAPLIIMRGSPPVDVAVGAFDERNRYQLVSRASGNAPTPRRMGGMPA